MSLISIGAVLWDVFDDTRHMGGAPFNVAVHAKRLGNAVAFVSAVGNDDLGREILSEAAELGLDTRFIRTTDEAPTGTVRVFLSDGQPDFTIHRPAAYDYPSLTPDDIDALRRTKPKWIYFGTLEQSSDPGRHVLRQVTAAFPTARTFYDIFCEVFHAHVTDRTWAVMQETAQPTGEVQAR